MADLIHSEQTDGHDLPEASQLQDLCETPRHPSCQQTREVVDSRAVIRLINLAADIDGRIVDISPGGCHVRTNRCFPVGVFRRVEVVFCIDGLPYRFAGVTQAIYDSFNVGIRFLDLSERKREQLMQLIDEIRERPPSPEQDG